MYELTEIRNGYKFIKDIIESIGIDFANMYIDNKGDWFNFGSRLAIADFTKNKAALAMMLAKPEEIDTLINDRV